MMDGDTITATTNSTTKDNDNDNNTNTNIDNNSSRSSIAQQWFALETTTEDREFVHILRTEMRELLLELYHFIRDRHWKKKLLTICVMIASCLVFVDLFFLGHIQGWIQVFMIWMTSHPTSAEFAFIGIYVLATLFFVPPTILMVGAGWAFAQACGFFVGILAATFSCFLGSLIGALLSFIRARYMMRDLIHLFRKRYPIVRAADQALKRDGFRIMLLLRLCPLIPFHGLNYLGGITGVSWETFVFSLVGTLPYMIMVVAMGASAKTISIQEAATSESSSSSQSSESTQTINKQEMRQEMGMIILTGFGVATFVIAMVLAFRFTGKELRKVL